MGRRVAALGLAAAWALAGASAARAAALDYLHVEANSGGSSGGHAALRFGDRVFDFQQDDGRTLRLRRSGWERFRHRTTVLANRTIRAARVELPDADYERLLATFETRHLVWARHRRVRAALRDDRRLLEVLRAGAALPPVEGAGLFEPGGDGTSAWLRALGARVADRHGAGFVAARRQAFERRLAALVPPDADAPLPAVDPERLPAAPYAFSERHRDLAQWIVALRALERAAPLRAGVLRGDAALDAVEARALSAWAERLEDSLVALVASERDDGGLALGVGMARLEAARRSTAERRLWVLDDLPRDADRLPAEAVPARDPYLLAWRQAAAERLARARARLRASPPLREADYDALEEAANDVLELDAALAGAAPLRLADGERIPAPAAVVSLPAPRLDAPELRRALALARAREASYEREFRAAFGYRLLTRNCVTELFAMLADALGEDGARRALGGPAQPPGPLAFVPFASFDAVLDTWQVAERWEEPAWRRARLQTLHAEQSDLRVYARESNTLTSTLVRRDPREPFFLFFTAELPPLRPLLGAANLAAAAGHSAFGLVRAPFDRGATLRDGLESALYSLPELAFVSIRKGTLRYGPPP